MYHLPSYGPVFHDALRVEERAGNISRAVAIADRGLATVPRYGPLWFGAFHVYERVSYEAACQVANRAIQCVSKVSRSGDDWGWLVGWFERGSLVGGLPCGGLMSRAFAGSAIAHRSHGTGCCGAQELLWKVHFERAQIHERGHQLDAARTAFAQSAVHCPANLLWKVPCGTSSKGVRSREVDSG